MGCSKKYSLVTAKALEKTSNHSRGFIPACSAGGHIPTAVTIPYDTVSQQRPTTDESALIIVSCRSGAGIHGKGNA